MAPPSSAGGNTNGFASPPPSADHSTWRRQALRIIEGTPFNAVMSIATVYTLFGDDIRQLAVPSSADVLFTALTTVCFILFLQELIIQALVKPGYFTLPEWKAQNMNKANWTKLFRLGSFYFYLDLLATLSLITEISYFGVTSDYPEIEVGTAGGANPVASISSLQSARSVRVVRLVRLIRVVKMYKYYKDLRARQALMAKRKAELEQAIEAGEMPQSALLSFMQDSASLEKPREESRVGTALSDITTRRVIVGILTMLIWVPLLTYSESDSSGQFALQFVTQFGVDDFLHHNATTQTALQFAVKTVLDRQPNVLLLQLGDTSFVSTDTSEYRPVEMDRFRITTELGSTQFVTRAWFDSKSRNVESSMWSIVLTIFVLLVLGISAWLFTRDAHELVLQPIEKMIEVVTRISENPLEPLEIDDTSAFKEGMETTLLLRTIKKIGGLLRVGFGEAGAAIIAGNLNAAAELDPCKPGRRINGIYGFCDIRCFTDTTECLQEEVMLFVNRIAEVVHGIVVQHRGAANKNVGDAFLLAWKFPDSITQEMLLDQSWRATADAHTLPPEHVQTADLALMSFLKIIAESERAGFVDPGKVSAKALKRLLTRIPAYKVRMGFGLHWGWAIEGAIGSDKKIDASYLSSHVKMAERLEGGTKTYHVPLLMTGEFHSLLSGTAQSYCRQLDHCVVPNIKDPIDLYTFDCNIQADFKSLHSRRTRRHQPHHRVRGIRRAMRSMSGVLAEATAAAALAAEREDEPERKPWETPLIYSTGLWFSTPDLRQMQHEFSTTAFREHFARGLAYFLGREGSRTITRPAQPQNAIVSRFQAQTTQVKTQLLPDWDRARALLLEASAMVPGGDGPSAFLISVMDEYGGRAPEDFAGTHFVDL